MNKPTTGTEPIRLSICGAAGRMGRRLVALAHEHAGLMVSAAIEHDSSEALGTDAGEFAGVGPMGVVVTAAPLADFDVMIDFTRPAATIHWLSQCVETQRAMVIGTTGLNADQRGAIERAARDIPIVFAPNFSVGVNVLLRVTRLLGETLDAGYDVEITEAHHRYKIDAPSGTAIALRDAVIDGRTTANEAPPAVIYGRHGETGARPAGEIGMHALRIGDTVGEHTVSFGALGETISISHSAHSRDTFASGALRAAIWVAGRDAGLYSMQDVLFGE